MEDLKKSVFGSFLPALLLTVGACAAPEGPEMTALPERTGTGCQRQVQHDLGSATSAFACRGLLLEHTDMLYGAARAKADGTYQLFSIDARGQNLQRLQTPHTGARLKLLEMPTGVMAVSVKDKDLLVTTHSAGLQNTLLDQVLELPRGQALHHNAGRWGDGYHVVAPNGHGVYLWKLDSAGQPLWRRKVLRHPEMIRCDRVQAQEAPYGGLRVRLSCRNVVPLPPKIDGVGPSIPDFDYGATTPKTTDILIELSAEGQAVGVSTRERDNVTSPPHPRAALHREMTRRLPAPRDHRTHVLDAIDLGGDFFVSLSCSGRDQEALKMSLALVECQPEPETPPVEPVFDNKSGLQP